MARSFDGTDDFITLSPGDNLQGGYTGFTSAAIVRCTVGGTSWRNIFSLQNSGQDTTQAIGREGSSSNQLYADNASGGLSAPSIVIANTDGWAFYAIRKATGTSTPRFFEYIYSTNTWTIENDNTTAADEASTVGASGELRFGAWANTSDIEADFWQGDMAVIGIWQTDVFGTNDDAVKALAYALGPWLATNGGEVFVLDQDTTSQAIRGLKGGAQQTAITGTSISTSAVPGFTYSYEVIDVSRSGGGVTAYEINAAPAAYSVTGTPATIVRGLVVDAVPGSYAFTGLAATLTKDHPLNAQPGSFSITGFDTTVIATRLIDAQPGVFTVNGAAASLIKGYTLDATSGAYTVSGTAASLLHGFVLSADPGVYTITGAVADLVYGSLGTAYTLNAEPGSFSVTGFQAALLANRVISADAGVFVLTGAQAATLVGRVLPADPGVYVVTGAAASALKGYGINAEPGVYIVTGSNAGLVPPGTPAEAGASRRVIHIRFGIYP